jgi:hypothetical protein
VLRGAFRLFREIANGSALTIFSVNCTAIGLPEQAGPKPLRVGRQTALSYECNTQTCGYVSSFSSWRRRLHLLQLNRLAQAIENRADGGGRAALRRSCRAQICSISQAPPGQIDGRHGEDLVIAIKDTRKPINRRRTELSDADVA